MNEYRSWLLCIFSSAVLLTRAECTDEQPYRIAESRSPNGKFELWVQPIEGEGVATGRVQIRQVETGQILGAFDWSGFGVRLVAPDPPFEVLWRKDSQYFAIEYELTRGWMTSAIYGKGARRGWVEIKTPGDEYRNAVKKMGGVSQLFGKGCDSPVEWNREGNLVLRFRDRNLCYDENDSEKEFRVTLHVANLLGQPLKLAKVESITQRSKAELEREAETR